MVAQVTRREANRLTTAVNDAFTAELKRAFEGHFAGVELESNFDFLGSMAYVSCRADGQPFTQQQADFIAAFETGFASARMALARALDE